MIDLDSEEEEEEEDADFFVHRRIVRPPCRLLVIKWRFSWQKII
jgi:hypothetical protein